MGLPPVFRQTVRKYTAIRRECCSNHFLSLIAMLTRSVLSLSTSCTANFPRWPTGSVSSNGSQVHLHPPCPLFFYVCRLFCVSFLIYSQLCSVRCLFLLCQSQGPLFWSAYRARFAKWFASTRPSAASVIVSSLFKSMLGLTRMIFSS